MQYIKLYNKKLLIILKFLFKILKYYYLYKWNIFKEFIQMII
jgi:hypothetical protein